MKKLCFDFCLGAMAVACVVLGVIAPASAQSTSVAPAAAASVLDSVTAYGQMLKTNGIFLQLGYNEDFSANVAGGVKTGVHPIGHGTAGLDLDFETILGLPGSSFHVLIDERNGHPVGTIAGSDGPLQADAGPVKYRLGEFYWEQGFNHDQIDITAGRTNPTFDFAFSDVSCQFVSSIICAQPGTWYYNNSDLAYPSAEWGGRLNVAITPQIYVRAAIYDEDPSQGGFLPAGFDWNTRHSVGVFTPVEVGYQTNFGNAELPAKYDAGFYDDTSSNTTPKFTQRNGTVLLGQKRQGRTGGWIQGQQTVWRPDRSTNQSLTVFGGGIVYNGAAPYDNQFYAGVLDRAPFNSRPRDTIGLIGSLYDINKAWHPNHSRQWIFEANYGFSLVPGATFKPYTQYVINPFLSGNTTGYKQPSDAWVIGFQVAISFNELLAFPQFIPH